MLMLILDFPNFAQFEQNGVYLLVFQALILYVYTILLVDAINWDITYEDLISKIVCDSTRKECIMHQCEPCPGRAGLRQFFDEKLSDVDSESEFHYSQWDPTDRASLPTATKTCEQYKDVLIDIIDKLTKHSYLVKCQAQYLNDKKEALVLGDFAED